MALQQYTEDKWRLTEQNLKTEKRRLQNSISTCKREILSQDLRHPAWLGIFKTGNFQEKKRFNQGILETFHARIVEAPPQKKSLLKQKIDMLILQREENPQPPSKLSFEMSSQLISNQAAAGYTPWSTNFCASKTGKSTVWKPQMGGLLNQKRDGYPPGN